MITITTDEWAGLKAEVERLKRQVNYEFHKAVTTAAQRSEYIDDDPTGGLRDTTERLSAPLVKQCRPATRPSEDSDPNDIGL